MHPKNVTIDLVALRATWNTGYEVWIERSAETFTVRDTPGGNDVDYASRADAQRAWADAIAFQITIDLEEDHES
jgi:hypothetical protein